MYVPMVSSYMYAPILSLVRYKSTDFSAPSIIAETGPGGGFVSLLCAKFVGEILST